MTKETLIKRIAEMRSDMVNLVGQAQGENPFADALVYEKSCQLDELIVEFMRGSLPEHHEFLRVV